MISPRVAQILFGVLSAVASAAEAQATGRSAALDTTPGGTIKGQVIDGATRNPVDFASVVLRGTSYRSVTDANGRFRVQAVTPGTYSLEVKRIGYVVLVRNEIVVAAGQTVTLSLIATRAAFRLAE